MDIREEEAKATEQALRLFTLSFSQTEDALGQTGSPTPPIMEQRQHSHLAGNRASQVMAFSGVEAGRGAELAGDQGTR